MANLSNINNKFLVTTGGNVLIGTTADVATVRLQVKNASAAAVLRLTGGSDSWDFDTYYTDNKLFIKSSGAAGTVMTLLGASGNVGIGTDSPAHKLAIEGGADTVIQMSHGSGAVYNWALAAQYITNNAFEIVPSTVVGGSVFTTPVATFKSDGNVGIGTTTPQYKFHTYLTNGQIAMFGSNAQNSVGQYCGIGLGQVLAGGTSYQKISIVSEGRGSGNYISDLHFLVDTAGDAGSADLTDSKMMISGANGYVGIGTNSPDAKLHIYGSASLSEMYLGEDAAADKAGILKYTQGDGNGIGVITLSHWGNTSTTQSLAIKYGGNVGIGTTSPGTKLEVAGPITMNPAVAGGTSTYFTWQNNGSTFAYSGSHASIVGGGAANDLSPGWCTGSNNLLFGTANVERMRITSGGNVGINYTGPFNQVSGSNETTLAVSDVNAATMYLNNTAAGGHNHAIFSGASGNLSFYDVNNTAYTIVIDNTGDVGIGTTAPNEKLEVKGNIRIDSRSKAGSGDVDNITFTKDRPDAATGTYSMGEIRSFTTNGYSGGMTFYSGRHTGGGSYALIAALTIGDPANIGPAVVIKNGDSTSARIYPETDNAGYLGESTHRWQAVYAVNGSIQTSDRNQKTSITKSDLGLDFILKLEPVSYKWKVGGWDIKENGEDKEPTKTPIEGKRNHYGLIAQQVKEVIGDKDFGGWVKEDLEDEASIESLRYAEFISPMIKAIQELKAEIELLKSK